MFLPATAVMSRMGLILGAPGATGEERGWRERGRERRDPGRDRERERAREDTQVEREREIEREIEIIGVR